MIYVQESSGKGRCKRCGKKASNGRLYEFANMSKNGKVEKRGRANSSCLCEDCYAEMAKCVISEVERKMNEEIAEILKGTSYEKSFRSSMAFREAGLTKKLEERRT